MGINYRQSCILGICLERNDIKRVISPEKYRDEPRFDPRTGKQTHTERVFEKYEECVYEIMGVEYEDFYSIEIEDLDVSFSDEEEVYIGKRLGNTLDCGRVDLLNESHSFTEIQDMAKEVSEKLRVPLEELELHFVTSVG
jgi:hypothetical protein